MIGGFAALLLAVAAPPEANWITIRDLVETADVSSLAVSPDGRLVAFRVYRPSVAQDAVRVRWYVQPVDGSVPAHAIAEGGAAPLNDAGAVLDEPPRWAPDSRSLFFRAAWDGEVQVWRAWVDAHGASPVTADAGNVLDFHLDAARQRLVYRAGPTRDAVARAEAAARQQGVLVDPSVDLALGISGGVTIDGRPVSQRLSGDWFARRGLLGDLPPREAEIRLDDLRIPSPVLADAVLAPTMAVRCRTSLCGTVTPLWLLEARGGDQVAARLDDAGRFRLAITHGSGAVPIAPGLLLAGSRDLSTPCALSGQQLLCVEAGPASPPRLVRIDLARPAQPAVLYDPNPGLRQSLHTRVEPMQWEAAGVSFSGVLLLPSRPRRRGPLPLVLHYYRCDGFLRGGIGDELPMHPLAQAGIAVLCVNAPAVRRDRPDAVGNYALALAGVDAIVGRLTAAHTIDPARVGMQGLSFGSEATMWVLRHSQLLKAASIASAQLEPTYYWFNAAAGRDFPDTVRHVWKLGDPEQDRERWRQLSAALDTASIRAPLLMQLPELEARWSVELFARLSRSPTPVELYVYPGATHIKAQPTQKHAVYTRNFDWFRFWLAGIADNDPAKADQYRRWRAMALRWREARDAANP